jgi:hypothetical protein
MTEINQTNIIEFLCASLPELEQPYKEYMKRPDVVQPPGMYGFFWFVLEPLLEREVGQKKITDFLRRFAEFMEQVCILGDIESINLIWVEVFERLIHRPEELRLLWPVLGSETKAKIEDAAARWGKIANLPISGVPGALRSSLRRH